MFTVLLRSIKLMLSMMKKCVYTVYKVAIRSNVERNNQPSSNMISYFITYKHAFINNSSAHTFIGTSYPLQRGYIVIMLANREGEHTYLDEEKTNGES